MQVVVVGKPDNDKIDGKDGINSIKVHLSKEDLHKLRHQYLEGVQKVLF